MSSNFRLYSNSSFFFLPKYISWILKNSDISCPSLHNINTWHPKYIVQWKLQCLPFYKGVQMEKSKWEITASTNTCKNMCNFLVSYISVNLYQMYYAEEAASWELFSWNSLKTNEWGLGTLVCMGIGVGASLQTQARSKGQIFRRFWESCNGMRLRIVLEWVR